MVPDKMLELYKFSTARSYPISRINSNNKNHFFVKSIAWKDGF